VIDVENADLKLRPGMTANVTIIYDQRDHALAIANAALRFRPPPNMPTASGTPSAGASASAPAASGSARWRRHGRPSDSAQSPDGDAPPKSDDAPNPANDPRTVYVLRNNVGVPVTIHVGLSDGTVTEILDGDLKEGDQVITDATSASAPPPAAPTGGGGGGMRRMF
jgi:HlyD family secretion protein